MTHTHLQDLGWTIVKLELEDDAEQDQLTLVQPGDSETPPQSLFIVGHTQIVALRDFLTEILEGEPD